MPDQVDKRVINSIRNSMDQQKESNESWSKYTSFIYNKSLSTSDLEMLSRNDRDTFDFNIVRPFIFKSLKNVMDSSMTATFSAITENEEFSRETIRNSNISPEMIADILNKKFQEIQDKSNYSSIIYNCAVDSWIGGKGIIKIITDYENNYNFKQTFKINHVLNPTRIYFDNKAKHFTKRDSEYAFEIITLSEEEFKRKYPNISIASINTSSYGMKSQIVYADGKGGNKLIDVVEYYYRENQNKIIYQLKNGLVVNEKPKDVSSILQSRQIKKDKIMMQRLVGDIQLTAPIATNFKDLPFIMVMGERFFDHNDKEYILPFAKHAFDGQRVKNIMMNYFIYEAFNNRTSTIKLPEECELDDTEEALKNPTQKKIIRYKGIHMAEGGQTVMLEPQVVPAVPLPDQYLTTFETLDKTIESSLGVGMPSLDSTNLSGKALYNLTQFISAGNEQFMQHLEEAVTQLAKVILDAMPMVLEKEIFEVMNENNEKISAAFDFRFESELFHIKINRGVSNQLQKEATIETLMDYAEKSPLFAQFMNTPEAITLILDNLDLNNQDKIMKSWQNFQEQQKIQAENAPPNPEQQETEIANINAQARLIDSHAKMADVELRAHELGINNKNKENDQLIEQHKIKSTNHRNRENNEVKVMQSKDNLRKHYIDHLKDQFEQLNE